MKLELLKTIKTIDNKKIFLPNSVFLDADKIVITDGGNNRVCVIDNINEYSIGAFGIGKYKFKEPVYSMEFEDKLFVCDWHNHRILQYNNKIFESQIGIFGNKNVSIYNIILRFVKSFASNGSFIEKHFNIDKRKKLKKSKLQGVANTLKGILFYGVNVTIFTTNLIKKNYINKPNGCVFLNNKLIFTQKNNKCISVYDLEKKEIVKEVDNRDQGIDFGRLGQISCFDNKIYVCDETNNFLWIFSSGLNFIDKKTITSYNIFSVSLSNQYIATCGETGFSVFSHDFELLSEKIGDGEYHGVALGKDVLYVCNRSESQIEKYKL